MRALQLLAHFRVGLARTLSRFVIKSTDTLPRVTTIFKTHFPLKIRHGITRSIEQDLRAPPYQVVSPREYSH